MANRRTLLLGAAAVAILAGCGDRIPRYTGPEVTKIIVMKGDRRMYLMHRDTVLRAYDIDLGFEPVGHKQVEGDGRTPEGVYWIDRRNPESDYYLSIGISYPNATDVEVARGIGQPPGGDIFIHGQPNTGRASRADWTAGCIAVSNREMREIYSMVRVGTRIDINP